MGGKRAYSTWPRLLKFCKRKPWCLHYYCSSASINNNSRPSLEAQSCLRIGGQAALKAVQTGCDKSAQSISTEYVWNSRSSIGTLHHRGKPHIYLGARKSSSLNERRMRIIWNNWGAYEIPVAPTEKLMKRYFADERQTSRTCIRYDHNTHRRSNGTTG